MNKVILMGRLTKNPEIKYAGKDNDMAGEVALWRGILFSILQKTSKITGIQPNEIVI